MAQTKLRRRVVEAAEAMLAESGYVSPLDVLVRIRWLEPPHVASWRQGRVETIEQLAQVDADRLLEAVSLLGGWAASQDLVPHETEYQSSTRSPQPLRFLRGDDAARELTLRTHWLSPDLRPDQRDKVVEQEKKPADLVAIMPLQEWECRECGGTGDLLVMDGPGPLCLECADLDQLVLLPSGDATLTRRARKASSLSAVVVRFSRARKRYERQGTLVEETALQEAEASCLADEEARARRRERAAARRPIEDERFQERFAAAIRTQFPSCPKERAAAIAGHAGTRGSGRVGRSRAGRELDPRAVTLAVRASVRHRDTDYDERLMHGEPREEARIAVEPAVTEILERWTRPQLTVLRGGLS